MASLGTRAWRDAALLSEKCPPIEAAQLVAEEQRFLRDLEEDHGGALVAGRNERILGWAMRVPQTNYISNLWVDPVCHRQGIGSALLDALMITILLDGFTDITIGTHADNQRAIALYAKKGFQIDRQFAEWSQSFGRVVQKLQLRCPLSH